MTKPSVIVLIPDRQQINTQKTQIVKKKYLLYKSVYRCTCIEYDMLVNNEKYTCIHETDTIYVIHVHGEICVI